MNIVVIGLEITGLNPRDDHVWLVSYYNGQMIETTSTLDDIVPWLVDASIVKVVHNALLAVSFLRAAGIEVVNYVDTMVMAQVIEGNVGASYTLEALAERYLVQKINKRLQNGEHWQGELTEEHYIYALQDAEVTFQLYHVFKKLIGERRLQALHDREQQAIPALVEVAWNGLPFDTEGWQEELTIIAAEEESLAHQIQSKLQKDTLNLQSPLQLKQALYEVGVEVADVAEETLCTVQHQHEAIPLLLKWIKLKKIKTTFGDKLLNQVTTDQRIHGYWSSIGTATGRMSCRSLALQALPRRIRPYVRAREGHVLVLADYSAIELRVLAYVSADEALSNVFHEGKDPHRMTAASLFNVKEEDVTEEQRNVAKVVNFGIVYGMTSHGLQQRLSTTLERDVLFEEAEQYRQRYFQTYPGVLDYQERMLTASVISTAGGREYGLHVPPLPPGSVKRFNYPIQSAAADGLKEALCLWHKEKLPSYQTIHLIHDEVILEVREEEVDEATQLLKEVMVRGMRRLIPTIPIEVEVEVRRSWS